MASETGGTYLPPVVASLVGEYGDLASTIVKAKALLKDFSATDTTAEVDASITPMINKLAIAVQMLVAFSEREYAAKIGLDTTPFILEMAKLKAEMAALNSLALGTVAATAAAGGGGGRGGGIGAIIGGLAAGGAGGIMGRMGFGQGAIGLGVPMLAGAPFLAGFGTIGGLAGFSIEHLLTTTLGLVGSLSEAFAGLGVIAAGAFATMAVGMGSDMVVMRSTIADTKTLFKTLTDLEQATIQYGAGSAQAQFYTKLLNTQMTMMGNTAGVQAELGLAKLAMTINGQWDQATSNARVQAVALLTQILRLGQTYIPLVANAAAQNFAIINTSIAPLFAWLKGPQGIGIFTDLENKFAKNLPTAIDTFNNAVEFLLRFLDLASNYTGGFMQSLDHLFTYLNSPSGFARVKRDVQDVINVFGVWRAFIVILVRDLVVLLSGTVGVGTSMIQALTGILDRLHTYLTSTSGRQAIGSLFQAHKQEILAIIQLLPKLIGPTAEIYLKLAVPLTNIATALLNIVNALISMPGVGPIIAYGIAFQVLAGRMFGVNLALLAFRGATYLATAAMAAFDIVVDANVISIIILAIIALIVVIVLLVTHWKEVTKVVQQVWKDVTHWVGQIVADVGKFFSSLGSAVEKTWSEFAKRPGYWIGYLIGFVLGSLIKLELAIDRKFLEIIASVVAWGLGMAKAAPGGLQNFLIAVIKEMNKLPGQMISVGESIVKGLWQGIQNLGPWLLKQLEGFMQGLVAGAMHAIKSSSPSQAFAAVGDTIPHGVGLGVNRSSAVAMGALAAMFGRMMSQGQTLSRGNFGAPAFALAGGGSMRGPLSIHMPITVQVSGVAAATPQGIGTAVQQAVSREFETLVRQLQGGVYSGPGQA